MFLVSIKQDYVENLRMNCTVHMGRDVNLFILVERREKSWGKNKAFPLVIQKFWCTIFYYQLTIIHIWDKFMGKKHSLIMLTSTPLRDYIASKEFL